MSPLCLILDCGRIFELKKGIKWGGMVFIVHVQFWGGVSYLPYVSCHVTYGMSPRTFLSAVFRVRVLLLVRWCTEREKVPKLCCEWTGVMYILGFV